MATEQRKPRVYRVGSELATPEFDRSRSTRLAPAGSGDTVPPLLYEL